MGDITRDQIEIDFNELKVLYQDLRLLREEGDAYIVGDLPFSATYNGNSPIIDQYKIKILLPKDYPKSPPKLMEFGGRIPKSFHTNPDGTLCLGAPLEVRMKFNGNLLSYVKELVIPYLYSYSYYEKYGDMPFGELSHGGRGILESYQELFVLTSSECVLDLLEILATGKFRGHLDCPCGSRMKLRKCHGPQLIQLSNYQTKFDFINDYNDCAILFRKNPL
ncbi:hypothetical protein E0485_22660 [Paenibacillus albiflavus]|uniref:Uncharacterized protein n=1 Tax=Paenibacillus albiflavus TaxID=2545760 RepID=A0A4R4DZD2_9BACL|nr:SEC-C domain-containing protein [Paenibacillus albiflavus]TCZ71456.1 hypothetical protein E0485_22660 [Paenibacillus albiflavus]